MEKQGKYNNMRQKILICRAMGYEKDEEIYCFKCCEDEKMSFYKNQYIYKFTREKMKRRTSVFQIIDIVEENEQDKSNIINLQSNEFLRPISHECRWKFPKEVINDTSNLTFTELQKEIRNMLRKFKWELYFAKQEIIDKNRKRYLFDTFGVEDESEFKKREINTRWFKEFNTYDMDFQFAISLYEFKPLLLDLIDKNMIIGNDEKMTLKAKYVDEIKNMVETTFWREKARTQMDAYIGVEFCDETKELIWGSMSPFEIKVEFSFFWTLIKSMLSLAYIPVIMLILQDERTKIYAYVFLALVYLIAIIFSDEKQVDRLMTWVNSIGNGRIGYVDFYYLGLIVSTTFVVFSIQLMQENIGNMRDIVLYLFADIMFAYIMLIFLNLCISLVAWGITLLVSITSIRKKGKYIWRGMKKLIKTFFWIFSVYCSFIVLDMKKYAIEKQEQNLGFEALIFLFGSIIAMLKIITIWKKTDIIEKDANHN